MQAQRTTRSPTRYGAAECARARKDFPSLSAMIGAYPTAFLDGPGGTQVPSAVIDAIVDCYRKRNVNAHGHFPISEELDRHVSAARDSLAALLGADSGDRISIGQNMTTLAFSLSHALSRSLKPGDEVVISALDHEANRGPWQRLIESGAVVREIPVVPPGQLDDEAMAQLITPKTRVVAIGCSSNALGTVNNIELACRSARAVGALVLLDAVHYAPHFSIDVRAWDVDFLLCSAYKFYGPHVGILFSKKGRLEALHTDALKVQDPRPPYRIETGTLNYPAIEGAAAAVDYLASWGQGATRREAIVDAMSAIARYEHSLAEYLWKALGGIGGVRLWGVPFDREMRAPTVSFTLDGIDAAAAAGALGREGLMIWDGDFYAPGPVRALQVPRGALLRVGFSMYNTMEEAQRLVAAVERLARA